MEKNTIYDISTSLLFFVCFVSTKRHKLSFWVFESYIEHSPGIANIVHHLAAKPICDSQTVHSFDIGQVDRMANQGTMFCHWSIQMKLHRFHWKLFKLESIVFFFQMINTAMKSNKILWTVYICRHCSGFNPIAFPNEMPAKYVFANEIHLQLWYMDYFLCSVDVCPIHLKF